MGAMLMGCENLLRGAKFSQKNLRGAKTGLRKVKIIRQKIRGLKIIVKRIRGAKILAYFRKTLRLNPTRKYSAELGPAKNRPIM